MVLYEMLTGTPPYSAGDRAALAKQHVIGQLRPPRQTNPEVPDRINAVTVQLLDKDPEKRHPNAAVLIEELKGVLRFLEVEAGSSVSVTVGSEPKEAGRSERPDQLPGNQLDTEDWFNEGNELAEQGLYEEAIKAYDRAIKLRPGYLEALNDKGIALDELELYKEAIESYDQAIESINPNYSDAWYNRGISTTWYNKGFTLDEQGLYEEAIKAYDQAIGIKRNHSDAWNNKGVALRKLGLYEEATKAYDRAIRINPDHPCARGR